MPLFIWHILIHVWSEDEKEIQTDCQLFAVRKIHNHLSAIQQHGIAVAQLRTNPWKMKEKKTKIHWTWYFGQFHIWIASRIDVEYNGSPNNKFRPVFSSRTTRDARAREIAKEAIKKHHACMYWCYVKRILELQWFNTLPSSRPRSLSLSKFRSVRE